MSPFAPLEPLLTEAAVRALRDEIYGPSSDRNWEASREHWMREDSVRWLREKVRMDRDRAQTTSSPVLQ